MSNVRNALRMAGTWPQEKETAAPPPGLPIAPDSRAEPQITEISEPRTPPRSALARVIRRLRRCLGLRVSGPVDLCSGLTRRGLPCRAPAMSNGLCRMHGGTNRPRLANLAMSRAVKP